MKQIKFILLTFSAYFTCFSQTPNDSTFNSLWHNKNNSIFENIHHGQFTGTTNGYIQLLNNNDTLLLDFHETNTSLNIIKNDYDVFDESEKIYSSKTTSGKTHLVYETFMLANILSIKLNETKYSIGVFDGACDTPFEGMLFFYSHEKNIEYLTLFVTKPLKLTTSAYLFKEGNITFKEASKNEKAIIILSGSTLIFKIKKD